MRENGDGKMRDDENRGDRGGKKNEINFLGWLIDSCFAYLFLVC